MDMNDDYWDDESAGDDGMPVSDINPNGRFEGDTSHMTAGARRAAIALKRERYIDGPLYDLVERNRDQVIQSLNNDMLELVVNEHYRIMYATPCLDEEGELRSLKTRQSLRRDEAAVLAFLRIHVLECENMKRPRSEWLIGFAEISMALSSGAGFLAGSNDEEGVADDVKQLISRMMTYGYLEPTDAPDVFRVTPLVPVALDSQLADEWLAISETRADEEPDTERGERTESTERDERSVLEEEMLADVVSEAADEAVSEHREPEPTNDMMLGLWEDEL